MSACECMCVSTYVCLSVSVFLCKNAKKKIKKKTTTGKGMKGRDEKYAKNIKNYFVATGHRTTMGSCMYKYTKKKYTFHILMILGEYILGKNSPYRHFSKVITKMSKLIILCRDFLYYIFIILYIIIVGWESINISYKKSLCCTKIMRI